MSCNTAQCAGVVRHFFVEEVAPLAEIPDYWPPIRRNAIKPDFDNHAWVLPTTSAQSKSGELVYDVIDNVGALSKRVRIPAGRSIAGFGRNGTVYLTYRDNEGWAVEKTRVMDTK